MKPNVEYNRSGVNLKIKLIKKTEIMTNQKVSKKTDSKPDGYILLAPVLNPKVSKRCGKGSCEFYNKHNKISGCKHFEDRRECSKSIKQRKQSANTSKKKPSVNWYGC